MTEKERQKLDAAHRRMEELEHQLEDAQIKNVALETMIGVAEEKLRISIRKKPGTKQWRNSGSSTPSKGWGTTVRC